MKTDQNGVLGRSVVGYDVRKPDSLAVVCLTSYDQDRRYETIYDLFESQLSGLNLFEHDPSLTLNASFPENGRVIAFVRKLSWPSSNVNILSTRLSLLAEYG